MTGLNSHYSARDIEARILAALRTAGLDPAKRLSPTEIAALDHFHTGGLRASRELLELAQIRAEVPLITGYVRARSEATPMLAVVGG